ncbi:unnamed protein product [Cochlearia groenlandica]
MECSLELKKSSISSGRPPFVADDKRVSKEIQRPSVPDKFRDDKRRLSYSDFHREITRKVEDVCPKRLENRLKSRIGRTASGERELLKYKSYVPSYTKRCEKLEGKVVESGSIGPQDTRNNMLSGDKQKDKLRTRSSLSNTSISSSLWTDESSTDSSRGLSASPFRKRVINPPLQYYLVTSKPGDCSQDLVPPRENGDTSQSHSSLSGNNTEKQMGSTRRDVQFHQSPRGTAFLHNLNKDSEFKVVPKKRTFLNPSKPDSPPCARIISKNLADDCKKKGEKSEERIRNPRVHDLFGKEKPAAVFVPRIISQKQIIGLSKFYDSKVLLAKRVAETNRKGFPKSLVYGQGAALESDVDPFRREADASKPFLKRINFLNAEKNIFLSERSCSAPRSRKAESSPCRSRTIDRRSSETLPKEADQKSSKALSERARSISPFRRLSFSIGKSSKKSNAEEAQTPPRLSTTLRSPRAGLESLDNTSTSSFSDSSSFDTISTSNKGRSSPLRRLLEPLIRPKSSHACRSPEPSLKGASLSHQKHTLSDCQPSSSSTVQALFRVTSKNDQPLFTFAVDKEQSITAATIRKQITPEKEDYGHKYTFFTVQEVQKKNGKWMNHGRKVQSQEYTSNIVAQMRVSGSKPLIPTGLSSDNNLVTKEFVLSSIESQQRPTELAAMVIKIPKIADTSSTTLGDYFADVDATVMLPSGIHSLPHKGGPSPLIQRWKSGGSCDCGGWDMGCNLRILNNQYNKPINLSSSTSDAFQLFFQDNSNKNKNQPLLSFTPYREGVYAVEYKSSSLTLLQAFSICIAVNESRNPLEPSTSHEDKSYGEVSSIESARFKSYPGPLSGPLEAKAPVKYVSNPPLSPVGRV